MLIPSPLVLDYFFFVWGALENQSNLNVAARDSRPMPSEAKGFGAPLDARIAKPGVAHGFGRVRRQGLPRLCVDTVTKNTAPHLARRHNNAAVAVRTGDEEVAIL